MKWLSLGVASLVVLMSFGASADETQKVGDWEVSTRVQDGKSPNPLCILRSPKSDGSSNSIQITNGILSSAPTRLGNAQLFVYVDANFSSEAQADLGQVSYLVDGRERWSVPAKWSRVNDEIGAITSTLAPEISAIVAPLAQGRTLTVSLRTGDTNGTTIDVPLAGSMRALAAFENCLNKVTVQTN